jgi:hypothetical protein
LALLYADENFPLTAVEALRRLGHDVLTTPEIRTLPRDSTLVITPLISTLVDTTGLFIFYSIAIMLLIKMA